MRKFIILKDLNNGDEFIKSLDIDNKNSAEYYGDTKGWVKVLEAKPIEDFINNKYLEDVESTIDFRGGYAAAIRDLKIIMGVK